jgi:hypothetical protein
MRLFPSVDGILTAVDRTFLRSETWDLIVGATLPSQAAVGGPDWGVTAENICIVWDSSSANSIEIKDYILAHWPWLADAVLVPINLSGKLTGTDGFESITQANFTSTIAPALAALDDEVRYPIFCYGMPTRIYDNYTANPLSELNRIIPSVACQVAWLGASGTRYDGGPISGANGSWSGSYLGAVRYIPSTWDDYPGTRFLPTWISFATVAATKAYVDKIEALHPGGSQIFVYDNRRGGQEYWFDDNRSNVDIDYTLFPVAVHYRDVLLAEFPDVTINYFEDDTDPVMQTVDHVKGLLTWGHHSNDVPDPMSQGTWTDGTADALAISDNSGSALFTCVVSWNGRRGVEAMNIFIATAGGGSAYANTPALFPAHIEESAVFGAAPYQNIFADYERGYSGGEVMWKNRSSIHFLPYGYGFWSGGVHQISGRIYRMDSEPKRTWELSTSPKRTYRLSTEPARTYEIRTQAI